METIKQLNKTNLVVKEATRIAAKDVRMPKVVRTGEVKRTQIKTHK